MLAKSNSNYVENVIYNISQNRSKSPVLILYKTKRKKKEETQIEMEKGEGKGWGNGEGRLLHGWWEDGEDEGDMKKIKWRRRGRRKKNDKEK